MNPQQSNQNSNRNQNPTTPDTQPSGPDRPSKESSRLKGLLLVLLLVGVAAAAAWILINEDAPREEPETDADEDSGVEIVITSDGFTPGSILVNPDTTVTWVNEDDEPHRVASNPHPDHDGLSGFDSQEPIFPDESYSYTFTETGEFGYHDHLNPETNGTIVVEEEEE